MNSHSSRLLAGFLFTSVVAGSPALAGADVIVGDLPQVLRWGTVGDITAYSAGTDSCNVGDVPLEWFASINRHPVIGQNLYRLRDGRMEQIGMGWLKHGFAALALNLCGECQDPGTQTVLGVNCSDPYSASLNGDQDGFGSTGGLGPRFEVDANSGFYPFPYSFQGDSGDAIFKRVQVHNADIDPVLNPGARYFVEGHYVTPDDAGAGNNDNNASYREVLRGTFQNGGWNLNVTGQTQRQKAAIEAWGDVDPEVTITRFNVNHEGRLILGSKCSDNGDGTWHYEYALYNMNSHRSVRGVSVPVQPQVSVSNVGFHDVDYHSGEPYDLTDWPGLLAGGQLTWETDPIEVNVNANALRWGTTYNFRFDAGAGPETGTMTIRLFRSGFPDFETVLTCVPSGCPSGDQDDDGICNVDDNCPLTNNPGQEDQDADGVGDACDNCPTLPNTPQDDCDLDGAGDLCDACPCDPLDDIDVDGVCGDVDNCPDTPNLDQINDDADTLGNVCDNCPTVDNENQADFDSDGVGDVCDTCTDLDGDGCGSPGFPQNTCCADNCPLISNPTQADDDVDGFGNVCDNCPVDANPLQEDVDGDGLGDVCDPCPNDTINDSDNDQLCADVDNCPTETNPDQSDVDSDGVGDVCDNCPEHANTLQTNSDGDTLGNPCDNCPTEFNNAQLDRDNDGEGDACDLDDGLIFFKFTDAASMRWQPESLFTQYNWYRGSLSVMLSTGVYTQAPGANPLAARVCGLFNPALDDSEEPAVGECMFYLASGIFSGTERNLGEDSTGTDRPNDTPCP